MSPASLKIPLPPSAPPDVPVEDVWPSAIFTSVMVTVHPVPAMSKIRSWVPGGRSLMVR